MPTGESLYADPNALAPEYSRFRVGERVLLTGHSHQAWPDCGFRGQMRAWEAAAEFVDDKWDEAFERADRVRRGWASLLGSRDAPDDGDYALGSNTHELVVRFLSALPLSGRPRLVTTDGEFHSIRRQLGRLGEEGLEIVRVPRDPVDSLAERIAASVDDRTAAALVSCVLFRDARIVRGLGAVQSRCDAVGAALLIDAYHALNAVPFALAAEGLSGAFVTGGGYKYCQLGEGNCFLRVPPGADHRPVVTGWFSEFGALEAAPDGDRVAYGTGADRFAGSTYDPTSHYRATEVLDFFEARGLTPEFLREVSRHQVERLAAGFDALDLDVDVIARQDVSLSEIGGFLALRSTRAGDLRAALRDRGVLTDHRNDVLRLGPAPYLSDRQLDDAIEALGEAVRSIT
ncbi:MAG: kynureninase [Gemmatimonadota bacterium]